MRAYSKDLRERAVAAVERGMARPEVVAAFGVSLASLKRWLATSRAGGDLRAKPPPGARPTIGPEQEAALQAQLATHPDATCAEHAELWNREQGTTLSPWTLGRAIRRRGWTRKKSRSGRPSATRSSGKRTGSASPAATRPSSSSSTSAGPT
jgi:transposase